MSKPEKNKSKYKENVKIKKLRLEVKAWTKRQLADEADVSSQTIRKAEKGENISEVSKARIAKALGVKLEELFPK